MKNQYRLVLLLILIIVVYNITYFELKNKYFFSKLILILKLKFHVSLLDF